MAKEGYYDPTGVITNSPSLPDNCAKDLNADVLGYSLVKKMGCKDPLDNLLLRDELWRAGYEDEDVRDAINIACKQDILFWINCFVWIFEAREGSYFKVDEHCLPFITYEAFQDETILTLVEAILTGHDELIEKSRDMGASWMCLMVFLWLWCYKRECALMAMSRTADLVDDQKNPDCLFRKLTYVLERLPTWMRPDYIKTEGNLYNNDTMSVIDGEATTENSGRAGRRMAILLDEFAAVDKKQKGLGQAILASTGSTTTCRIFNSTPKGTDNAFFLQREIMKHQGQVHRLHWTKHPEKRRGLYRVTNGRVEVIDKECKSCIVDKETIEFPKNYKFIMDGRGESPQQPAEERGLRSPWFDHECSRTHSSVEIAEELNIDYHGSGAQFVDAVDLQMVRDRDEIQPYEVGDAQKYFDESFNDSGHNPMALWYRPDAQGRPPLDTTYSMGIDISTGTGASDSCISVEDAKTGRKLLEYVSSRILPEDLAALAVCMAKMFSTPHAMCYMAWDGGGPGGAFGKRIIERLKYQHVYYHVDRDGKKKRKANRPGWFATAQGKLDLLTAYRSDLIEGLTENPSGAALTQLGEFVHTDTSVAHVHENTGEDPSGNKKQHGDRTIADVLAHLGSSFQVRPVDTAPAHSKYCFAAREEEAQAKLKEKEGWLS